MGGDAMTHRCVKEMRAHDYLYDPSFVVSNAKDYARMSFRAAMESSQKIIRPVFDTMFSAMTAYPATQVVYYPNCRLPSHMDISYESHAKKISELSSAPAPTVEGNHAFKFIAAPRPVLASKAASPEVPPPPPSSNGLRSAKPKNKKIQTVYRESSAQTHPWQPEAKVSETAGNTPEVLHLENFKWGINPRGDLPIDFHTTSIINKMRHARAWMQHVEDAGEGGDVMSKRDIIVAIETRDWLFREAEIDELQMIRLQLLRRIQLEARTEAVSAAALKLGRLWDAKKGEMERRVAAIRHKKDRELRKLRQVREGGGQLGAVERLRAARAGGDVTRAAARPDSALYANVSRYGKWGRNRHAQIYYNPGMISELDVERLTKPPAWVATCQDLKKTCSGHNLVLDGAQLCERETRWTEEFLAKLHQSLKDARLGAKGERSQPAMLVRKRGGGRDRPSTARLDGVDGRTERRHQAALALQKLIRGRAVQNLMYEGRRRSGELIDELQWSHGLQEGDRVRIADETKRVRDLISRQNVVDQKTDKVAAMVDEICGEAISDALSFLEKELRRLKEERRQHAYILIAMREKQLREAAEAGRRQKEERRRKEHDQIFKQVVGLTQQTVDAYLADVVHEAVEESGESDAVERAVRQADALDEQADATRSRSEPRDTPEMEMNAVSTLVRGLLLPAVHRQAARDAVELAQQDRLRAARQAIFRELDDAVDESRPCPRCGRGTCPCKFLEPQETRHRHDPRWKRIQRKSDEISDLDERIPPKHEFAVWVDWLIDEAVIRTKHHRDELCELYHDTAFSLKERLEIALEINDVIYEAMDLAMGGAPRVQRKPYHYTMYRLVPDAAANERPATEQERPTKLPSEYRRDRIERHQARVQRKGVCLCAQGPRVDAGFDDTSEFDSSILEDTDSGAGGGGALLPSQLRAARDLLACKCDEKLRAEAAAEEAARAAAAAAKIEEEEDDNDE